MKHIITTLILMAIILIVTFMPYSLGKFILKNTKKQTPISYWCIGIFVIVIFLFVVGFIYIIYNLIYSTLLEI